MDNNKIENIKNSLARLWYETKDFNTETLAKESYMALTELQNKLKQKSDIIDCYEICVNTVKETLPSLELPSRILECSGWKMNI